MAFMMVPRAPQVVLADPTPVPASTLFAQAMRENSNLEMDWLWLATQISQVHEQQYCFARALYINPASEPARQGLRRLAAPTIAAAPVLARSAGI
jgi:hypothetical protein